MCLEGELGETRRGHMDEEWFLVAGTIRWCAFGQLYARIWKGSTAR